ncbi:MAG: HAD-IA family hydrolase [Nitrosomonadales bacterium]
MDDTLHKASPEIFKIINHDMTSFISNTLNLNIEESNKIRQAYWEQYGATLTGLIQNHKVNPDNFLKETHKLEKIKEGVIKNKNTILVLKKIKSKKILLTNAPRHYAKFILSKININSFFWKKICIEDNKYKPKPDMKIFQKIKKLNFKKFIFIDDSHENIKAAKINGFYTIWINNSLRRSKYANHSIKELSGLLKLRLH